MAIAKHIIPGEKFGRLTIIGEAPKIPDHPQRLVFAKCECGLTKVYRIASLRSGHAKSCGCYMIDSKTKHGQAKTMSKVYKTWSAMKNRCSPTAGKDTYAGKGIQVCNEWMDFANFFQDMGERPDGMTLDRIDNTKGYFKENCRWASNTQQANNRSNSNIIAAFGKSQTVMEWADETKIPFQTIRHRVIRGWSPERCVTK